MSSREKMWRDVALKGKHFVSGLEVDVLVDDIRSDRRSSLMRIYKEYYDAPWLIDMDVLSEYLTSGLGSHWWFLRERYKEYMRERQSRIRLQIYRYNRQKSVYSDKLKKELDDGDV